MEGTGQATDGYAPPRAVGGFGETYGSGTIPWRWRMATGIS